MPNKKFLDKKNMPYIILNIVLFAGFATIMGLMSVGGGRTYDLEISHRLADSNSFFGFLFAIIGEAPAYIIIPVGSIIIAFNIELKNPILKSLVRCIFIIFTFIGFFTWMKKGEIYKLLDGSLPENIVQFKTPFAIVIGIIFTAFAYIIAKNIDKKQMRVLFKFAVFAICVVLITLIVSRIMKKIWTRPRYRNMDSTYSTFTPWYQLNGIKKKPHDDTSFPSGHTISAANALVLIVLCDIYPKLKKWRPVVVCFTTLFIILTAVSRIVAKAHFLSDVTFGAYLSYLGYILVHRIFFKNKKFVFNNALEQEIENERD